jgi:hypothetical protein
MGDAMPKQDPHDWSEDKIAQVERNVEGMRDKYDETGDPDLLKGIETVEGQLDEAHGITETGEAG